MCVVYEIRNTATGDFYIGSAANAVQRWHGHRTLLRSGAHHSKSLQQDWQRYGEDAFAFSVIHEVQPPAASAVMPLLEIAYIRERQPVYNERHVPGYVLTISTERDGTRTCSRQVTPYFGLCPIHQVS